MYIEVILPLKLSWAPTYLADAHSVVAGQRVRVSFARKEYVGVVSAVDVSPTVDPSAIQPILGPAEGLPPVSQEELEFWKFLSDYYLCTPGEVFKAAYPAFKTVSEESAAAARKRSADMRRKQIQALEARIAKLEARLVAKEDAMTSLREKAAACVKGGPSAGRRRSGAVEGTKAYILLDESRKKISVEIAAARKALGAFVSEQSAPAQNRLAAKQVRHSVTASKPLVIAGPERYGEYIDAVEKALSQGLQILVLTPETAFCRRLTEKLGCLGDRLSIFTSESTPVQKRKVADALRNGESIAVTGTRSAIFLPFSNLGLIIIDEEQDISYRQSEPAPRYNGRDAALMLARIHNAEVILGTASPSLETELNILNGKFIRRDMPERVSNTLIIDVAAERRKNGMVGPFSRILIREAAVTDGRFILVRGWENRGDLEAQASETFGAGRAEIMTLSELKRDSHGDIGLIAVVQADALVGRDDFRADERGRQLVAALGGIAERVIVQTAVADRFNSKRSTGELMAERKDFGLPPYTRIADAVFNDNSPERAALMKRRLSAEFPGGTEMPDRIRWAFARDRMLQEKKKALRDMLERFERTNRYTGHIHLEADPL